jgi:hypothetical protein
MLPAGHGLPTHLHVMERKRDRRGSGADQMTWLCMAARHPASAVASLVIMITACTPEAAGPPLRAPAKARDAAALPMPDTAFTSDGERDPAPATASRFATRHIGEEASSGAPRFHGAPIDLDLKSADLPDVFRLLADVGHVNIVVTGEITGTVTLRLKHVPWDQALDVVARAKDLDLERDGNVIIVTQRKH